MATFPKVAWIPAASIDQAGSRLRAFLPCDFLKRTGYPCEMFKEVNKNTYNIVVFQKTYGKEHIELAKTLKNRGVKIVFDLCDNNFVIHGSSNTQKSQERLNRLKEMIELSDAVSVPTPELSKSISHHYVVIIDDAIDDVSSNFLYDLYLASRGTFSPLKKPDLKLVWYGNKGKSNPPSGLSSLSKILPEIEKLNSCFPSSLTIISDSKSAVDKFTQEVSFPIHYYEWNRKTFQYIFRKHDVCIIPVDINPLTLCKSNNRLVSSLMLGLPVIADKLPSYAEFHDFVLFSNWHENLLRYGTQKKLREEHVIQGQTYISAKYSNEKITSQWKQLFEAIYR